MNKDEIMKIEAGKELDVLILQRFFGVKKIYYMDDEGSVSNSPTNSPYYIPSGKPWRTHRIDSRYVPYFSTDVSEAWRVVVKMSEPPTTMEAASKAENTKFAYIIERERLWACTEQEAALRICRAALLAVMDK